MRMRVAKEDLLRAKQQTEIGKTEYDNGKKTIDQVINGVNNGKIGGSVSAELLSVYEKIKPTLEQAYRYFDEADGLMLRANKEYDVTTEETSAALKSHRI